MKQKTMDDFLPYSKRSKKHKKELDTWVVEEVNRGLRSIKNPDISNEEYPFVLEDCTEVTIRNMRTRNTVMVRDDIEMLKFWETVKGFTFKWKGGKRIQKKTIIKALKKRIQNKKGYNRT